MTEQELRNIPIGGIIWYTNVVLCKAPGIKLLVNDRPCRVAKLSEYNSMFTHENCGFKASGLPRGCNAIIYQSDNRTTFPDEKSAVEYYCEEIQKATKEIAKRKREYCKNANAYAKKIQDDAIKQMNNFLNGGDVDAV